MVPHPEYTGIIMNLLFWASQRLEHMTGDLGHIRGNQEIMFCEYWTSIEIKINMTQEFKEY